MKLNALKGNARAWAGTFKPMPIIASRSEKILSCLGAFLGLVLTERFGAWFLGSTNVWFIAPMGASAVLLFAVPSSPLAQPWSILGGNLISAFIGVTCGLMIPDRGLAAGVSVSLAIACMFRLRCLHPPSGAVALTAVLGGQAITHLGYWFIVYPVAINSLALTILAIVLNKVYRRNYPHKHLPQVNPHQTHDPLPSERLGFTPADLELAISRHRGLLDISQEDLANLLSDAEVFAHRRRFGDVRCADIMSKDLILITANAPLSAAWHLMMKHNVTGLPVINEHEELVGMVSYHDFFVSRVEQEKLLSPLPYDPDAIVREVMSDKVISVRPEQPIADLVSLFSDAGLHTLPVLNDIRHVVGVLTQSDVIAGLYQAQVHGVSSSHTAKEKIAMA